MNKLSIYFLLLSGIFLVACNTDSLPTTSLNVNLASLGAEELEVSSIEEEIYHHLKGEEDSLELDLTASKFISISKGRSHHYFFVKPGEKLVIDTIPLMPNVLGVIGEASSENKYLAEFANLENTQSNEFRTPYLAKKELDSFLIEINNKYQPLNELMAKIEGDETVDANFKSALDSRLKANRANDLLMFKGMYNHWHKKEPTLPEDFYADIENMDFTDPALVIFDAGRQLGESWCSKDVDYDDYESESEYFAALLEKSKKIYPNSLLGEYSFYSMVSNSINYGDGIDGSADMIEEFRGSVNNTFLNNKLDKTIEPWLTLKAGLDAPDFKANTRDGEEVMLSDLKGKKVYIDVWATWCGPCVKEIPSLKKLEKELHEENIEFVSVSIDSEKDKEKWKEFIKEKEMTGVQLMANNAWESDVATGYNVKAIPRFLLIDEEGKIISANAPRPSDESIKEVLLN